jgi:hypothetical protein
MDWKEQETNLIENIKLMTKEDIKKVIEKENLIIKNGSLHRKTCIENCVHHNINSKINCSNCKHRIPRELFLIMYYAREYNKF